MMSQPRRPAYPQSSDIGRRGGEKGREEREEERRGGEGGGPKRAKRVKEIPKRVYPADKFDFKI